MGGAGQGLSRWVVATATWQSLTGGPAREDEPAAREGVPGSVTTAVSNSRAMRELEKGRREECRTGSLENWRERGRERGVGRIGRDAQDGHDGGRMDKDARGHGENASAIMGLTLLNV